MPRQQPKGDDDYGRWIERVIGSGRLADNGEGSGRYSYLRMKMKRQGITVVADVYPDFGSKGPNDPHLWGVFFPKQDRLTKFDTKTHATIEVRAAASEKRFGRKEETLEAAKAAAYECITAGRTWDGLRRRPDGTLMALEDAAAIDDPDDVPFGTTAEVSDDVPEGEF